MRTGHHVHAAVFLIGWINRNPCGHASGGVACLQIQIVLVQRLSKRSGVFPIVHGLGAKRFIGKAGSNNRKQFGIQQQFFAEFIETVRMHDSGIPFLQPVDLPLFIAFQKAGNALAPNLLEPVGDDLHLGCRKQRPYDAVPVGEIRFAISLDTALIKHGALSVARFKSCILHAVIGSSRLRDLLGTIHVSPDATTALYIVCSAAQEFVGSRNAMIAELDEDRSALTLRAGTGADWQPAYVGQKTRISDEHGEGIISWTAISGASYVTGDVSGAAHYRKLIEGTKSEMASPIFDRYGRVRGVINVESDLQDRFDTDAQETLEMLAMIAGYAFDREESNLREEAFWEVGTALDEAETEQNLLARVSEVTQKVLRVSAYSVFLWDPAIEAFTLADTVGSATLSKEARYMPGEGVTGWVCQHGLPIRLENPTTDPRWRGRHLEFPVEQIYAFLCVPIFGSNRTMGCIRAIRKRASNPFWDVPFTEDDERLLMAIADQLGAGLVKIRSVNKLITNERMAAIGELSARTSHMIGNRLFGISGEINELRYVLNEQPFDQAKAMEAVERLAAGIRRLEEIIQDYKDLVTATKIHLEEADLNAVVREAAMAMVPKSSKVDLRLELNDQMETFAFDANKIGRAVSELVENAMHFMSEGSIVVGTDVAAKSDFETAGWQRRAGKFAKIWIEDKGPGVEPERKNTIFGAYQSSRSKGMGLGLSIVKGIADAHGGTVFEDGVPGKGARFVVLIPMRTPA